MALDGTVTCCRLDSRRSNTGGGPDLLCCPDWSHEAHPASCTMGTGSSLGVKWPDCDNDH